MSLHIKSFMLATLVTIGFVNTGCTKHESEGSNEKFRTEEIAAKQGEAAKAAVQEPTAKEPATYTAMTAPSSGTATTTNTTSSPANTATATATSSVEKTEVKMAATEDNKMPAEPKATGEKTIVKETTTVTTKVEEKK